MAVKLSAKFYFETRPRLEKKNQFVVEVGRKSWNLIRDIEIIVIVALASCNKTAIVFSLEGFSDEI